MFKFIAKRIALTIPTIIGLMLLTFIAIRLVPGDPIEVRTGEHGISPERLEFFRHQLGLDQPIWKQFLDYAWGVMHGDFGHSLTTNNSVLNEFLQVFPATLELSLFAIIVAVFIGIPVGMLAAVKRGSVLDQGLMSIAVIGYSMPIFWWGPMLVMLLGLYLHWLPISGRIDLAQYYFEPVTGLMTVDALLSDQPGAFWDAIRHLIMPAFVLGTIPLAVIARMTRSSMLEVMGEDYIRTARAKGLSTFRIIGLHALRNALIPVVTTVGLMVSVMLSGAVLTENTFAWPGIGNWLIASIQRRDYPILQGGVLLVSLILIFVNLGVDLLYALINPRIRHGR